MKRGRLHGHHDPMSWNDFLERRRQGDLVNVCTGVLQSFTNLLHHVPDRRMCLVLEEPSQSAQTRWFLCLLEADDIVWNELFGTIRIERIRAGNRLQQDRQ